MQEVVNIPRLGLLAAQTRPVLSGGHIATVARAVTRLPGHTRASIRSPIRLAHSRIISSERGPEVGCTMSRMKGNFHVRFFEGGGLATARLHSAYTQKSEGQNLPGRPLSIASCHTCRSPGASSPGAKEFANFLSVWLIRFLYDHSEAGVLRSST